MKQALAVARQASPAADSGLVGLGLYFRVSGFRVSGFRVQGFRVYGLGFQGLGWHRAQGTGHGFTLPHRLVETLGRGPRSKPRAPMQMVSGALSSFRV